MQQPILQVSGLSKTYASGFQALKNIDLTIKRGEIFALLGPNGAGKTTLIGIVCGIVNPTAGTVAVDGHDIIRDYRAARKTIGLVPPDKRESAAVASVRAALDLAKMAAKAGDISKLEATVKAEPASHQARIDYAMALAAGAESASMLTRRALCRPSDAFAFSSLRTEASSWARGISPLRPAARTAL